jgi:O-antigen ligase/polysaccharide polymerase Wzy-like membrane protein
MLAVLFQLVLAGNLLMGRSFAYWGFQPAKLFIGEAALAALCVWHPAEVFGRWFWSLSNRNPSGAFSWAFLLFLEYGVLEVWRGFDAGYSLAGAVQNFAYNCYPMYFFVGWWLGETCPDVLTNTVKWFAWVHGAYGLAYIAVLDRFTSTLTVPGAPWVPFFGQPSGSAIAILGLLCLNAQPSTVVIPLCLNTLVLLGMQVRAEWLALLVGLLVWSIAKGRIRPMITPIGVIVALLVVGYIIDFTLPGTSGRPSAVSARMLIARGIAPLSEELAVSVGGPGARHAAETFNWRTEWWNDIWRTIHESRSTAALGFGYGFALDSVTSVSMPGNKEAPVRTPHSVFYYALGYSGWIGVAVFFFMQLQLGIVLMRAYAVSGQPFGLAACAGLFAWAFFDASFEAPYRAIPFFIIAGISTAPLLSLSQAASTAVWKPAIRTSLAHPIPERTAF